MCRRAKTLSLSEHLPGGDEITANTAGLHWLVIGLPLGDFAIGGYRDPVRAADGVQPMCPSSASITGTWKIFRWISPTLPGHLGRKAVTIRLNEDLAGGGGGTPRRTGDWVRLRLVAGFWRKPLFPAGGLTPDNIAAARTVHPYGPNLSSGVETARKKKRQKILAAVAVDRHQ